jgi:hypothetical protein
MDPYFYDDLAAALFYLGAACAVFAIIAPICDWLEKRK